jgi:4-aminobutyrate aminotransferase / (S)-3-amino-2-methylpropionate transaminase / 5-aminovalerate transaminase
VIGDVDGIGLALRIEICERDGFTPNRALLDRMVALGMEGNLEARGRKYGLVLDVGGYYKNVITLAPALTITFDEIDLALELLDQALTKATRAQGA